VKIGEVTEATGVPASAIRFYESQGILPPPVRKNGIRQYDARIVEQLRVLRFFRSAGMSTEAIASIFADGTTAAKTRNRHAIVLKRMAELDEVIVQARRMRRRLTKLLACECHGEPRHCVIFKEKPVAYGRRRAC
jgi:DNA-binding transcriptional MerR regulator